MKRIKMILSLALLVFLFGCQNANQLSGPDENQNNNPPALRFAEQTSSSASIQNGTLLYEDNFEDGDANGWEPNRPGNWRVEDQSGSKVYRIIKSTKIPNGGIRKPTTHSFLTTYDVTNFTLIAKARCLRDAGFKWRDLSLFFGVQDTLHYYYAHFGAFSDANHNVISIVNNADRTKINTEPAGTSTARMTDTEWHTLKVERTVADGSIKAYIDDMDTPILTAIDTTFKHGKIGLGTFDDYGQFDDVQLWGDLYESTGITERPRI